MLTFYIFKQSIEFIVIGFIKPRLKSEIQEICDLFDSSFEVVKNGFYYLNEDKGKDGKIPSVDIVPELSDTLRSIAAVAQKRFNHIQKERAEKLNAKGKRVDIFTKHCFVLLLSRIVVTLNQFIDDLGKYQIVDEEVDPKEQTIKYRMR